MATLGRIKLRSTCSKTCGHFFVLNLILSFYCEVLKVVTFGNAYMEFVRSNWSTKCINRIHSIHFLHKDTIKLFQSNIHNSFWKSFGTWDLSGTGSSLFGRKPHQTWWHNGSINLMKQLSQNMPYNNLSDFFPNPAVMLCNQSRREVTLTEVLLKHLRCSCRWPYWIIYDSKENIYSVELHAITSTTSNSLSSVSPSRYKPGMIGPLQK